MRAHELQVQVHSPFASSSRAMNAAWHARRHVRTADPRIASGPSAATAKMASPSNLASSNRGASRVTIVSSRLDTTA